MASNVKASDVMLTLLVAVIAGAAVGAAAGLVQNWFGWRTGFIPPMLGGIIGAGSAIFYRARQRQREQAVAATPPA